MLIFNCCTSGNACLKIYNEAHGDSCGIGSSVRKK